MARRRRQIKMTEAGIPDLASMPGVDTSYSEDPAIFWGPTWKEDLEESLARLETTPRKVYYSLEEFFAALDEHVNRADRQPAMRID
ncbi:MAG: hypothetical protein HYX51_03670 [Chloroflexi bacterium]|nr:hypothetical protein [Chloroflexota bacterium]